MKALSLLLSRDPREKRRRRERREKGGGAEELRKGERRKLTLDCALPDETTVAVIILLIEILFSFSLFCAKTLCYRRLGYLDELLAPE